VNLFLTFPMTSITVDKHNSYDVRTHTKYQGDGLRGKYKVIQSPMTKF
jgi:hypothetical protein